MSTQVASLYAKLGLEKSGFDKGLKEAKGSLTNAKANFKDFAASAAIMAGVLGGAAVALKQVYEIAKQGAALENVERKFTRLSSAVGSTADALLVDLRKATKGTLSDAQLMSGATDLMSLGLTKTHDQTVRLSRVIGGLGMDMNQLVLTLANQTTMRFDQLGVAVDGFDERLKTLKDSGMDANAAFTEAFLQQAEAQLIKTGNSADTSAGAFMRLEAAIANVSDELKMRFAPGLANAAEAASILLTWEKQVNQAVKEQNARTMETSSTYDQYVESLIDTGIASGKLHKSYRDNAADWRDNRKSLEYVLETLGGVNRTTWAYIKTSQYYSDVQEENAQRNKDYADRMGESLRDQKYDWEDFADTAKGKSGEVTRSWEEIEEASRNAAAGVDAYKSAIQGVTSAQQSGNENFADKARKSLEAAGVEGEDFAEAMGTLDSAYGTTFVKQDNLNQALKDAAEQYKETGDIDAYKKAIEDQKPAFDDLDKNLQNAKKRLMEVQTEWRNLITGFASANGMHIEIFADILTSGGTSTGSGTGGLYSSPAASSGGTYVDPGTGAGYATGGRPMVGRAALVGERGPELFVPDVPGRIIPNHQVGKIGNSYNLNVYTTQSTQVVQRGFQTLQILAGV